MDSVLGRAFLVGDAFNKKSVAIHDLNPVDVTEGFSEKYYSHILKFSGRWFAKMLSKVLE